MNMHIYYQPRVQVFKPELIRTLDNNIGNNYKAIFTQRHGIYDGDSGYEILFDNSIGKKARRPTFENTYDNAKPLAIDNSSFTYANNEELIMFNLKCELINYFCNISRPSFDTLLLQQLKLANMLVNFEVISTDCSKYEEKKTIFDPKYYEFSNNNMDIIKLLMEMIRLLLNDSSYRNSPTCIRRSSFVTEKYTIHKKKKEKSSISVEESFRRFTEGLRHYLDFHMYRSIDANEFDDLEILCKLEMCDLLTFGINLRQDYLINNVISWFKTGADIDNNELLQLIPPIAKADIQRKNEKSNIEFEIFYQPVIEPLTNLYPRLIGEMLVLFVSSKNYQLQTRLLSIIFRLFSQRKEMLKSLSKIKIMTLENDSEIYSWAKMSISALKNLTEQSAIICKY